MAFSAAFKQGQLKKREVGKEKKEYQPKSKGIDTSPSHKTRRKHGV